MAMIGIVLDLWHDLVVVGLWQPSVVAFAEATGAGARARRRAARGSSPGEPTAGNSNLGFSLVDGVSDRLTSRGLEA